MRNSEIYHFDSIHSAYTQPYNDPFNAKYYFATPLNNVKKIHFKSIELPVNFCNIRNVGTMNVITIKTNLNNVYSITIPQSNYITISSLITAINTAFVGIIPGTTITCSVDQTNTYLTFSATSSTITSFVFVDTILTKYILGFRNVSYSGLTINAPTPFLLNVDHYVTMYIQNVPTENNSANGKLLMSFKIPLNATNGILYFIAENSSLKQYVRLLESQQTINHLQIVIYDRFNNQILNNNSDYSFSLEIEFD